MSTLSYRQARTHTHKHMKYKYVQHLTITRNYKHSLWHFIRLCPSSSSFMLLNYVSHRYHWNTSCSLSLARSAIPESHIMRRIVYCKERERAKKYDQQWKQNFIARSKNASNSWVMSVCALRCMSACKVNETLRKIWEVKRECEAKDHGNVDTKSVARTLATSLQTIT